MSRRARLTLLAGAVLTLSLMGGVALHVAGTERGLRIFVNVLQWAVPGLTVQGQVGTLIDGRVEGIEWHGEQERVSLARVRWHLDRGCLGRLSLCFKRLAIERMEIALSGKDEGAPPDIAPLSIPVDIDVEAGELANLFVWHDGKDLVQLEGVHFSAALIGSRVDVAALELRVHDVDVRASGRIDIERQLPLSITAATSVAGWPAIIANAKGDLQKLALEARVGGEWPLALKGTVELLAEHMPVDFELQAEAPLALPGEAAAYGALVDAHAAISGNLRGMSARLQAQTGSAWIGKNQLDATLRWAPEAGLELQHLLLQGEAGTAETSGTLGLSAALPLHLAVQFRDACLPRWSAVTACRVGGGLLLDGTLGGDGPMLDATLDLRGDVGTKPALLRGRVTLDATGAFALDEVLVENGANRLRIAGRVGEVLALEGALEAASLADSVPGAEGHGRVGFRAGGTRVRPEVDAELHFAQLRWRGQAAKELDATLRWRGTEDPSNRLEIKGAVLALPGLDVQALEALLTGSRLAHVLSAEARIDGLALGLGCAGGAIRETGDWSGSCRRLDVTTRETLPDWQLDHELSLAWNAAARRLAIEPFCLRSRSTSACSTGRIRVGPDLLEGIALRADALPVRFLSAWMPPDLQASGTLALALDASRRGAQPLHLDARLSSSTLRFEPLAAGEEVPFEFRDIEMSLRTEGEALRLHGLAFSGSEGRLDAAVDMAGTTASSALSGSVKVTAIDVGPMLRVVPGSLQTAGRLDGRVSLAGTVAAPSLSGELAVTRGRFAHESLPQPIDDFRLALRFEGADAQFDGSIRTRAGVGNIDGALRWAGEDWSARLRLHAQDVLLEPRRGSRIRVAPDVTVELDPSLARISGEVRIPEAEVDLEALPGSAISVSPYTVIVGREKAASAIDYALSLDLVLGKKVHLRGFGVDARLDGALRLVRNPDAPFEGHGEVRIPEGRYTAYGQRLEVTEGSSLVFNGPLARPALRINAVRRIEDEPVEVGMQVRGDAKAPELKVFSRPAMPESRALDYLLTGRAPATGTDNELALGSAMMQLGISGAGKVTSKIFGKLGIQDFQVDSRKVEGGTEVQLSGYLTPDLYLRYGVSTFEKVNTFRLRYRLTPRFFVEAVSGVENAVDFLYSFSR